MNCWVKISQTEVNGKNEVNLTRRNSTRLTMGIHLYFFKLPVGTTNNQTFINQTLVGGCRRALTVFQRQTPFDHLTSFVADCCRLLPCIYYFALYGSKRAGLIKEILS